ncbi:MAG TPA: hypothetical protein VFI84_00250 [Candidatus Saccharimonadales bacterium]|nr:hypothetical protein [Candidatus Saccharimonadales bacterium]
MSEELNVKSPEQGFDKIEVKQTASAETANVSPEQQAEQLESARAALQELAPPKERLALPIDDKPQDNQPLYIDKTVKKMQMKQSMKQVRRELSLPERALSKLVHQPVVKAVSDVSAKTVSRPSGLLGGGFFAFVGSLAYLYFTTHIGMPYNYLLLLLFFAGGFALGLALELALHFMRPHQSE